MKLVSLLWKLVLYITVWLPPIISPINIFITSVHLFNCEFNAVFHWNNYRVYVKFTKIIQLKHYVTQFGNREKEAAAIWWFYQHVRNWLFLLFKPWMDILISFLELQFKMLSENESLSQASPWNSRVFQ